jgi:AcrR family transcriptional regulator
MTDQNSRGYRMKARAESKARTRRRIIEATVDLHATVGPAFTEISEVARRAGVRRVTVYSHFPDEAALLGACSAHWRGLHPAPDPSRWSGVPQPQRVQAALVDLYRWYRETEPMTANVLRDMERLPALRQIIESGLGRYLDHVHALLLTALDPPEESRQRLAAVLRVAMAFPTWRALADLGDDEAASLAAGFVGLARTDE